MNGKLVRMHRITEKGKAVIIPMDHGVTVGPIAGLANMDDTVSTIDEGGASAVVLHKGIIRHLHEPTRCGMIMHLSASTKVAADPDHKVIVGSVNEALRLGAEAVSVHVNVGGSPGETEMLSALGSIAEQCDLHGMPLLAMMYPRGKNIDNGLDPEAVSLAARVGAELGADIVKTNYTGSVDTFKDVVRGCPVPIVIAGGPKCANDRELLTMVHGAMDAGAMGVSLGRNAFQHDNPAGIVRALRAIVVGNASVDEAMDMLSWKDQSSSCYIM